MGHVSRQTRKYIYPDQADASDSDESREINACAIEGTPEELRHDYLDIWKLLSVLLGFSVVFIILLVYAACKWISTFFCKYYVWNVFSGCIDLSNVTSINLMSNTTMS